MYTSGLKPSAPNARLLPHYTTVAMATYADLRFLKNFLNLVIVRNPRVIYFLRPLFIESPATPLPPFSTCQLWSSPTSTR